MSYAALRREGERGEGVGGGGGGGGGRGGGELVQLVRSMIQVLWKRLCLRLSKTSSSEPMKHIRQYFTESITVFDRLIILSFSCLKSGFKYANQSLEFLLKYSFPLPKHLKNLDPSYRTDLDLKN